LKIFRVVAITLLFTITGPGDVEANDYVFQLAAHAATLSDAPDRRGLSPGFGYAGRAGLRWQDWGAFVEAGQSAWVATATSNDLVVGVFNFGVGGEHLLVDERIRMSAAVGSSTLLSDVAFDEAGSTGWFIALRPISVRWPLFESHTLELTPISAVLMQPDFSSPTLQKIEYQTMLTWEFAP